MGNFCVQCGTALAEHHKFCPTCGSGVESAGNATVPSTTVYVTQQSNNRMVVRQDEIKIMDDLIRYFSVKQPQYDEYDEASEWICRLSRGNSKAAKVWGIIIIILGSFFFLIGIATIADIPSFFIMSLLMLGGGIALEVLSNKLKQRNANNLVHYTNRYYELSDELYDYYCKYNNCPIGPEYTNPTNLAVVKRTIISGRADTVKEALNVLVEDAHREKMENIAAQTAQYAQQAAQYAQQTADNTDSIRRVSAVTAMFTVANYFK